MSRNLAAREKIAALQARAAAEREEFAVQLGAVSRGSAPARSLASGMLGGAQAVSSLLALLPGGRGGVTGLALRAGALPLAATLARGLIRSRLLRYGVLAGGVALAVWWFGQRDARRAERDEEEPPPFDDPDPSLP